MFGPRRPYWIETWPLAALTISFGIVKAETLSGPFFDQPQVLRLDLVQPADARAENHAGAEGIFAGEIEPRIAHGVDPGHERELREAVESLVVFGRDVTGGIPVVDIAAEADFVVGGVEQPQGMDAAFAAQNPLPEVLNFQTQRGDRPEAGDDDTSFHAHAVRTGVSRCIRSFARRSGSSPRRRRGC